MSDPKDDVEMTESLQQTPSASSERTSHQQIVVDDCSPRSDVYEPQVRLDTKPEESLLDKEVLGDDPVLGPEKPATLLGSAFHIFKGNVGVGIFLLPSVYNDAGYILSPVLGFVVGLIVVDAMLMLLRAKQSVARGSVQTYPDVVNFIFGSLFKLAVDIAVVGCQLSFCLMYVQVAADIFANLLYEGGYKLFVLINTILVIPFAFLSNNLRLLSVSSGVATCLVFVAAVISLVKCGQKIQGESGPSTRTSPFGEPAKWVLLIASSLTVLEGICIVLPVENSVSPRDKPRVKLMIGITMFCILIVYFIFGEVGNLAFGEEVTNSIVTVLPLDALGDAARIALAFNLLLTHPLQFVPAIEIIDRALGVTKERVTKSKKAFAMRIGLNINIMMMAMLLGGDAITLVLSLIGATAAVFLAIILPPMLQLHVDYAKANPQIARTGKDYFRPHAYIVFGLIIFVVGTATTLIDATGFRKTRGNPGAINSGTPTTSDSPGCNHTCTCPPQVKASP